MTQLILISQNVYFLSYSVVDCGTLGDPANGLLSISTTTYNSVATYSCNIGHNLIGDDMRMCLETGSWSGSEPICPGELLFQTTTSINEKH